MESRGGGGSSRFRPKRFEISWGVWGKNKKIRAGGATLCVNGRRKKADPDTYIKENMGKVPKKAVFGNFAPGNLKTEQNYIAYYVGIIFLNFGQIFF